jgi:hypothetical protein
MALAIERILKTYQKHVGITKLTSYVAGREKIIYRSRIIYQEKLLTKYFDTYQLATNHKQIVLFKNNKNQSYKKPKRTYDNSPFKFVQYSAIA